MTFLERGLREGAHAEKSENHYHKGTKNTVFFNYVLFYGCLNICIRQKDKLNTKLDFFAVCTVNNTTSSAIDQKCQQRQ